MSAGPMVISPEAALARFGEAVSGDLILLAALHHQEVDDALLHDLNQAGFPAVLGLKLQADAGRDALERMASALAGLPDPLGQAHVDALAADFADIYLNHGVGVSPHESYWLDEDQLLLQLPTFEVRAWYGRHGLGVQDWRKRSDDHLVHELRFLSVLLAQGTLEALAEAAEFMDVHLLRWLDGFAQRVAQRCDTDFYAASAWLTWHYCEEMRAVLADILGRPRPTQEEVEAQVRAQAGATAQAQSVPMTYMPGMAPSW